MVRRAFCVFLLTPFWVACRRQGGPSTSPSVSRGTVQEGLASWYGRGDGYHGRRTASGERFDRDRLTAAHFDLPFGTRVRVRNLRNHREVVVTINDRFPAESVRKGRIIDLSYAAARRLRMVREGVVPVRIEVIGLPGQRRVHPALR